MDWNDGEFLHVLASREPELVAKVSRGAAPGSLELAHLVHLWSLRADADGSESRGGHAEASHVLLGLRSSEELLIPRHGPCHPLYPGKRSVSLVLPGQASASRGCLGIREQFRIHRGEWHLDPLGSVRVIELDIVELVALSERDADRLRLSDAAVHDIQKACPDDSGIVTEYCPARASLFAYRLRNTAECNAEFEALLDVIEVVASVPRRKASVEVRTALFTCTLEGHHEVRIRDRVARFEDRRRAALDRLAAGVDPAELAAVVNAANASAYEWIGWQTCRKGGVFRPEEFASDVLVDELAKCRFFDDGG